VHVVRNKESTRGVVSRRMPYRDDEHALQTKKEQLEQDRARIEEHKRALAHLADDEARVVSELADVERRLAKRKKSLPLLGEVRVASPCHADWNDMVGDDQSRFCDKCAKNVYNLSALTTQQAEALIQEKEGKLCVRYYQRADGTVLTTDCLVGVRKKRVKAAAFVAAFGAAGAGLFILEESMTQGEMVASDTRMGKLEAFDGAEEETVIEQKYMQQTMGVVAFPEEEEVEKVSDQIEQEIKKSPSRPQSVRGAKNDQDLFPHKAKAFTQPPALPDHPIEYRNTPKKQIAR
jgi:hypothetical protein